MPRRCWTRSVASRRAIGWPKVQLDRRPRSARLDRLTRRANDIDAADRSRVDSMQVTAISTPTVPEWRWRISNYSGVTVEESEVGFLSIAAAVAAGTER